MKNLRRTAALFTVLPFLAQAIGAAEIAGFMGPAAARAALAPPPGRFAPAPRPAPGGKPAAPAPARRAWLADARVVAAFAAESLSAVFAPPALPPTRPVFPARAEAPAPLPSEPPAPPAARPADRIMIAGGSGVIGAYGELESPFSAVLPLRLAAYKDRFTGFWSRGDGVSLRVDYLRPWGINKADAEGFTMLFKGRSPHRIQAPGGVPPLLRREHPVYFAGDEVTLELTLRNDGPAPLARLVVDTRQEGLMLDGSAGPALDGGKVLTVDGLAPGEEARVRWTIRMSRRGTAAVNFEQTAVRVSGVGQDGDRKVYANVHQAGIVDPPAP